MRDGRSIQIMKLEILEKEHFYHIYNRGINSEPIFMSSENKNYFLKLLKKHLTSKVSIFAYCLMDNHFHIIIRVDKNEKEVTQSFSNLFNAYAKAFNKQNSRTGSLFEKHFKRIRLNNDVYLKQLIVYVHLNPQHHLGINFKSFKYSSYQSILSNKKTELKRKEVINLFDNLENFKLTHLFKSDALD